MCFSTSLKLIYPVDFPKLDYAMATIPKETKSGGMFVPCFLPRLLIQSLNCPHSLCANIELPERSHHLLSKCI